MFNAFVFAAAETRPGGDTLPADVTRVPPPTTDTGLAWRNAAYAVQWWIFGAFALWMWFRIVRDDARRERAHPRARTPSPPPTPPGPTRPGRERTPT